MNFFDHKDLGNHLLQLFPKVVIHPVYTPTISPRLFFLLTPPMKLEQAECSETSAHKKFRRHLSTQKERMQFKGCLNPIERLLS
jgi:hypothetical protein